MTSSDIATLLMSVAALVTSLVLVWKARGEKSKITADSDKTHAETYALLSDQLKEAYAEIDKLRDNQNKLRINQEAIICHREYEAHILRCLTRLANQLSSHDLKPICEPLSFEDFMKRRDNGDEKTEPIK